MADIIVLVEAPDTAAAALRFAHRWAAARSDRVVAVEPVTNPSTEHTAAQEQDYLAARRAALAAALGGGEVEVVGGDGGARESLLADSTRRDAAAVVIASPPVAGVTSYGFGSTAHVLAHSLACPLVVVPDGPAGCPQGDEVVVGIDGSAASDVALLTAATLADELGGGLCAVYTVDDIYRTFTTHGYYGAAERLVRAEVGRARTPVRFVERFGHHPADVLADVAREHRAQLLVVAARDHHSLGGALLGGVPDHLLHRPPCPVMVLPRAYVHRIEADAAERPGPLAPPVRPVRRPLPAVQPSSGTRPPLRQ